MGKPLRAPAALAFVVSASALAVASCGDDAPPPPPIDGAVTCLQYCVPNGPDETNCPDRTVCVSDTGTCPEGCVPEPIV